MWCPCNHAQLKMLDALSPLLVRTLAAIHPSCVQPDLSSSTCLHLLGSHHSCHFISSDVHYRHVSNSGVHSCHITILVSTPAISQFWCQLPPHHNSGVNSLHITILVSTPAISQFWCQLPPHHNSGVHSLHITILVSTPSTSQFWCPLPPHHNSGVHSCHVNICGVHSCHITILVSTLAMSQLLCPLLPCQQLWCPLLPHQQYWCPHLSTPAKSLYSLYCQLPLTAGCHTDIVLEPTNISLCVCTTDSWLPHRHCTGTHKYFTMCVPARLIHCKLLLISQCSYNYILGLINVLIHI